MKKGILYWNDAARRYGIQFEDGTVNTGLHCGHCLMVLSADMDEERWIDTRIEFNDDRYDHSHGYYFVHDGRFPLAGRYVQEYD